MQYRLVYDVLNDGPPWLSVFFAILAFLFAAACFLVIRERLLDKRPSETTRQPRSIETLPSTLVLLLGLVMICIGGFYGWYSCEAYSQLRQCQELLRTVEYEITEGTITDYEHRRVGTRFRIVDRNFYLSMRFVGFTGRFNAPGARDGSLRDGLRVRLAHRHGFILRVEIAADRTRE
jgi:hypothetical protein